MSNYKTFAEEEPPIGALVVIKQSYSSEPDLGHYLRPDPTFGYVITGNGLQDGFEIVKPDTLWIQVEEPPS